MTSSAETPPTADEWCARGDDALRAGRLNEAVRAYRRAVALEPDSAWYLQSLGEASARKGWFLVASTLFRRARQRDPEAVLRWFCEHTPLYDAASMVPAPIFVLGCLHSGTTILARLLANHPAMMLADARETHLFTRPPDEVNRRLAEWDQACVSAGRARWVEKSVDHIFMAPKLRVARPQSHFVVVVRDGRDVVASIKARQYAFDNFDDVIACWTQAAEVALELAEWRGVTVIRYEDLVRQPEQTLRGVCEAIGEAWTPEMLDYEQRWVAWNGVTRIETGGDERGYVGHQHLRTWQVNQPLFDGSGRWRTDLTVDEQQRVKALAQPLLERFGYVDTDAW